MNIDKGFRAAYQRAEHTCARLELTGMDKAVFMTVFNHVREAELKGDDTWPLWNRYMSVGESDGADLAIAAYIEAVASIRKAVHNHG